MIIISFFILFAHMHRFLAPKLFRVKSTVYAMATAPLCAHHLTWGKTAASKIGSYIIYYYAFFI